MLEPSASFNSFNQPEHEASPDIYTISPSHSRVATISLGGENLHPQEVPSGSEYKPNLTPIASPNKKDPKHSGNWWENDLRPVDKRETFVFNSAPGTRASVFFEKEQREQAGGVAKLDKSA